MHQLHKKIQFNFNHDNYKNKQQKKILNKFRTGNDTLPKFNRILNDNAKKKNTHTQLGKTV